MSSGPSTSGGNSSSPGSGRGGGRGGSAGRGGRGGRGQRDRDKDQTKVVNLDSRRKARQTRKQEREDERNAAAPTKEVGIVCWSTILHNRMSA
jgi:hypothetical protein